MRERPLVYLVPPMAAALYATVCLELPVQLHIIAPIALLLVLAAVFLRRHKCLLTVFAVLAAAALALDRLCRVPGFAGRAHSCFSRRNAGDHRDRLAGCEVYDTDQRVLLSAETTDGRRFRLRCYLPETEPPLLTGDRVRAAVALYVPDTLGGFDRAAYQASEAATSQARMRPTRSTTRCSSRSWTLNGTACALRRRGSHGSAEMRCSVPFRNVKLDC